MPRYVVLLRGINIGAKKRIAMADLTALVEGLGHANVSTYVNSGNVAFTTTTGQSDLGLATVIETALAEHHSLDVAVVVRSGEEMASIVATNPFPEVAATPKLLHVSFLSDLPARDKVAGLSDIERGEDDYRVVGRNIYLHYPNGISGAAFMVNGFDKVLGVTATSRNWRTVLKLAEMTRERG